MTTTSFQDYLHSEINKLKESGLYKGERIITSQQQADITIEGGEHVLNFCANNYLGLANNKDLIASAKKALDKYGFGMSSVRFICGTQSIHKELEKKISEFLQMEDTIL